MGDLLVVEDDADLSALLRITLEAQGHDVALACTVDDAVGMARQQRCDVMLIDLGLPDGDGKEAVRAVREEEDVPIIVITARAEIEERVAALDAGADDYIVKPFAIEELCARVRAQLRRVVGPARKSARLRFDGVLIDVEHNRAQVDGRDVRFTPTEMRMLVHLARCAGELVSHERLYEQVWPDGNGRSDHYVRVYVQQIRKKLGDDAAAPTFILTEPAHGYRWLREPVSESPWPPIEGRGRPPAYGGL